MELHKAKNLLHSKDNDQQGEKATHGYWEKIFANIIPGKVLISKKYKVLIQFNSEKKKNNNFKNGQRI